MSILQEPNKLHRVGYILVWAQAILGGVLLAGCWPTLTHGILAVLLAAALLCVHKGKVRAARGVVRGIVSLFWALAAMLAIQTADAVTNGLSATHLIALQNGVCWFGAPFLCYLSPAAAAAMLFHGENTAVYDRLMACLIQPALVGAACMALFTDAEIPWTVGGDFLPYIWLILAVATTLIVWLCARIRTPAQEVPITRRREKREAKRAERIAKK